jgi:hypothetical protein
MILGLIIRAFFWVASGLIRLIPIVDVKIPIEFINALSSLVAAIHFFLPVSFLATILALSIGIRASFIVWRVVLRGKSFVPMWGN